MTTTPVLREGRPADLAAVEELASDSGCIRWGGMPRLTETLLTQRWQQPQLPQALIQVVETGNRIEGYADVYLASPSLAKFHGIASRPDAARTLIDWARTEATSRAIGLQARLPVIQDGVAVSPGVADHPAYDLLTDVGFRVSSTTRRMRLPRHSRPPAPALPPPYRLRDFDESLLPSLLATYYAAWPRDYSEDETPAKLASTFRRAAADLHLALGDGGGVVGYVLTTRTQEYGAIDEVAVHPDHHRRGLGEVLVLTAIESLGDRVIYLVVIDDNPAIRLYERLGFSVLDENLDLVLAEQGR